MNTSFVRIGNRIVNLALVTVVNMDTRNHKNEPVIAVGFDRSSEIWFQGEEYEPARKFFSDLAPVAGKLQEEEEWAVVDGLNQRIR